MYKFYVELRLCRIMAPCRGSMSVETKLQTKLYAPFFLDLCTVLEYYINIIS